MYLIVPAANNHLSVAEICHIEKWAEENILVLNFKKLVEIVFVPPRSWQAVVLPVPAIPKIVRVESIKALGATISRKFSITHHAEKLRASCAQTLFALRTLRQHGLQTSALSLFMQSSRAPSLPNWAMPRWPGGVSPVVMIEIGWKLFSVVLPGLATEVRRTQTSLTFVSSLIKCWSTEPNETSIIFYTHFSRQNAVNNIRYDSSHITFKFLCKPPH